MSSSSQSPPRGRGVIARVPGVRSGILKMIASIPSFDLAGYKPSRKHGRRQITMIAKTTKLTKEDSYQ
jgi:hypothetical protein